MSKSPKQLPISILKDRNKRCFNRFIWCPLSCLRLYYIIYITISTLVTSQETVICRLNKNDNIYIVESSVNVFSLCACANWTVFTKLLVSSIHQDIFSWITPHFWEAKMPQMQWLQNKCLYKLNISLWSHKNIITTYTLAESKKKLK